jgi:HK97 family phage major capsid protein
MNSQEKLAELIKEVLDPKLKDQAEDILEQVKTDHNTMEGRIAALEAMPTKDVSTDTPEKPVETEYKGRKLAAMGKGLNLSPEVKDEVAKMFIDFIEASKVGKAALNETTTTQGGYLVFDEYVNELLSFVRLNSLTMQKARVLNVSSDSIRIPTENTAVSVAFANEAASISQSEPTVGELNLTPAKLAAYSIASNELIADSQFDILTWLTSLYGEAMGQEIDNQVFNGSTFTGLISAAGITEVETSTNTTAGLTVDYLAQVVTALPQNKNIGAEFYMNRAGYRFFLALEDDVGNQIWTPAGGPMGAIWGIPVNIVEQFPSDISGNSVVGIYGNLSHYIIALRQGMDMAVDPYGAFTTDQTRFRATMRIHGEAWDASAFCQMKI